MASQPSYLPKLLNGTGLQVPSTHLNGLLIGHPNNVLHNPQLEAQVLSGQRTSFVLQAFWLEHF